MPKGKIENWEKEFDEEFFNLHNVVEINRESQSVLVNSKTQIANTKEIKSFIRRQIAEAEKRGYEKGYQDGKVVIYDKECDAVVKIRQEARKEVIEEIEKWAKEHYWDSLENKKDMILLHLLSKLQTLK